MEGNWQLSVIKTGAKLIFLAALGTPTMTLPTFTTARRTTCRS
jgi:hypothetical protein